MKWARPLVLLSVAACGESPLASDAGPVDAAIEKKQPPASDASEEPPPVSGPEHLADTGLYSDFATRTLAPGVIAYAPRYALWADGAGKKRWLWLPPGTTIDTTSMDDWIFPVGTKAWKEFSVGARVVETRLLMKVNDTQWWESAYAWTADGTDAVSVPGGVMNALGTTHEIPTQADCNECHVNVRDVLVGVSAVALGASDGDGTLAALASAGRLTTQPAAHYDVPGSGAAKDALGYLHANCGHCHNAGSAIAQQTPMRLRVLTTDATPDGSDAYRTSAFLTMKHPVPPDDVVYALLPGAPDRSGIAVRMARRDSFGMPPEGTAVVDDAGLASVRAWIGSMRCGAACTSAPAP